MRTILQLSRQVNSLLKGRSYEFDEKFTVEDGEPMRTDLTLGSGGHVEYTCSVAEGKEVVVGLVEAEEAERVGIGVKDSPDFVENTGRTVRPGDSISERVTVPGGEYFILVATDRQFFPGETTDGGAADDDVTGAIVELTGESGVHLSSYLRETFTPG